MLDHLHKHLEEVASFNATQADEIEAFRIKYLGKKGILNDLFASFKSIPNDQKKEFGQLLNQLKTSATDKVNNLKYDSKSIKESNLPEHIRIGAVVRKEKVIIPRSDFIFDKDDLVVFLAKREHLKDVENIFRISSV